MKHPILIEWQHEYILQEAFWLQLPIKIHACLGCFQ